MGKASVDTHVRTPSAISSPAARSVSTSPSPPTANIIAIAAPAKPPTTCAHSAMRPLGRNSPVASVRSFPSRAAIAAPRRPTHNVRFRVNGAAPGMPAFPAPAPFTLNLTLWVGLLGAAIAAREGKLLTLATGEFLPKADRQVRPRRRRLCRRGDRDDVRRRRARARARPSAQPAT